MCYIKKTISILLLVSFFFVNTCYTAGNSRKVILTFDDGPHAHITERILQILKRHKITATFFLVGLMIEKYPDLVKKIYESGSEIGNHTYSDTRLTTLSKKEIEEALNSVNVLLEKITGKRTSYFRPPGGRLNDNVIGVTQAQGYHSVLWTRHVDDTAHNITKEKIIRKATDKPRQIELIMMHDGPRETIKALPEIIKFYKNNGYEFTTISRVTPPMFKDRYKIVRRAPEWPIIFSYNPDLPAGNFQEKNSPVKAIGIITLVASVGGTAFFIRSNKKKNNKVSLVFLNSSGKNMRKILKILRENNIIGTFFLSDENIEELADMKGKETNYHSIAYLKNLPSGKIKDNLTGWKNKLGNLESLVMPFYYSQYGYTKKEINEIKEEGFLPVSWKMTLPERKIDDAHNLVKYIIRRLKTNHVIPVKGDCMHTIKVLPDLIKEISLKGYSFLPLNEFIMKKQ